MIRAIFNRRLLVLAILFVGAIGAGAMTTLPRTEDPVIQSRNAAVTTLYPGASALRVEALVTRIIEDELRTLAEIDEIGSTSRADVSIVSLTLKDEVTDVAPVWSRVRDKLADVEADLPDGIVPPDLDDEGGYAYTVAFAVHPGAGRRTEPLILQRYAQELADVLRAVPGTELVELHGENDEVVQVSVEDAALRAAGLDVAAVARALAGADARVSAGSLTGPEATLTIELANTLDNLSRLRAIPLQGQGPGSLVLGDVASFERQVSDPPASVALLNGQRAVVVGSRMQPGQRVDLWVPQALAAVERFGERDVLGVETTLVFEQASYTTDRLRTVLVSLGQGLAIVVTVLLFTMGWRSALSVGLAIPTTALLTAGLFPLAGITLNQMSIIGVIVALGLMVDNAIIMTNEIRERLARGDGHEGAIRAALRKLFFPLLASTFTTMLAFMPIVLLPGGAGEFVGPMSIAVICALGSSFLVSMFVVPALAPILFREGSSGRGFLAGGLSLGPAARLFRWAIERLIRRPVVGIAICLAPVAIGIASLPTVPTVFFPPADRDQFRVEMRLPQSTAIGATVEVARAMDAFIRATEGVTQTIAVVGAATPQLYYNVISSESANPAFGNVIVNTTGAEATSELIPHFQRTLAAAFPEAAVVVRRYEFGPPVSNPIEMRIYGPELDVLAERGQVAAGILGSVQGAVYARAALHRDAVKLEVEVDDEAARLVGLDAGAIARQLGASFSGTTGGFVLEGPEQLPVLVRYGAADRAEVADLAGVTLVAPGAPEGVPLTAVADIRPVPAWTDIQRLGGDRIQSVSAFVEFGVLPSVVQARYETALEEAGFDVPPGYAYGFEGAEGQRSEAVGRLLSQVGLLLVAAVTCLVLTFDSFRRMGMVFAAGILALGMGMLVLKLTANAFGFIVIIGIMGLIGVGINGTIVMLEVLDEDEEARAGDPRRMSEIVTGHTARHIWSTTFTTAGGFVPLILLGGDFWPPFAEVFAGGLLLLTLVTFVFTPCAYKLVLARRRLGWDPPGTPPPPASPAPAE